LVSDGLLTDALLLLPEHAKRRLRQHLESGGQLSVEYGWDWRQPGSPARRGCPAAVALSPIEFAELRNAAGDDRDLLWLAEELFPTWASAWVREPGEALPAEAVRRLLTMIWRY
jgi:hypothetical protein